MMNKLTNEKEAAQNTMLILMIRRGADKYHEKAQKHRRKAEEERQNVKSKIHEARNGGGWAMCREMGSNTTAPLIAHRDRKKAKKGQPKGTVATSPTEIDAIIRRLMARSTQEM